MTREELRKELDRLIVQQNAENREFVLKMGEIQKNRDTVVRAANDKMASEKTQESLRHKEALMAIENERQQLFADYKMQKQKWGGRGQRQAA